MKKTNRFVDKSSLAEFAFRCRCGSEAGAARLAGFAALEVRCTNPECLSVWEITVQLIGQMKTIDPALRLVR